MDNPVKPLLGLTPKYIWEQELQQVGCDPIELKTRRLVDIFMAVRRFYIAYLEEVISLSLYTECTGAWLAEAEELKRELIPNYAFFLNSRHNQEYAEKIAKEFFYSQCAEKSILPKDAIWSFMPESIKDLLVKQAKHLLGKFIVIPRGNEL